MCTLEPESSAPRLHSRVSETGSEFLLLPKKESKKKKKQALINHAPYPSVLTYLCKGFWRLFFKSSPLTGNRT